jgi:hypothetical protein
MLAIATALTLSICLGFYALHGVGGSAAGPVLVLAVPVAIYALAGPKPVVRRPPPAAKGRREVPPPDDFIALWPLAGMPASEGRYRAGRRGRNGPGGAAGPFTQKEPR